MTDETPMDKLKRLAKDVGPTGPRVRPLVFWQTEQNGSWKAETYVGDFWVYERWGEWVMEVSDLSHADVVSKHAERNDAFKAAQAEATRRVLSMLEDDE